MTKNTLGDLNGYLFEQMERLNNDELTGEALQEEINRSRAIGDVAKSIIQNGNLVLQARRFADDRFDAGPTPRMLEG